MASDEVLQAAEAYCERGWPVFVLKPRSKQPIGGSRGVYDATTDLTALQAIANRLPDANLAVAMTEKLVVLDVDTRNGGDKSLSKLIMEHGEFPDTPNVQTGGGGRHYYFEAPGGALRKDLGEDYPGLDIKAKGGYVVAPPSVHPDGPRYEWRIPPDECDPAPMPAWLVSLARARRRSPKIPEQIAEGKRNETLARLAGKFVNAGMSEGELRAALHTANEERCNPPLPEFEVDRLVNSAMKWERHPDRRPAEDDSPPPEEPPPNAGRSETSVAVMAEAPTHYGDMPPEKRGFPLTDMGNGERLVAHHGQNIRWCPLWKAWLVWDGRRWVKDEGELVMALASRTVRKIILEGYHEPNEKQRAAIGKWAIRSEEISRRRAMVESAKSEDGVVVSVDALDRRPMDVNFANGTLDLQSRVLRPHAREDLATKLVPIEYDPNAEAPLWNHFLDRIMQGNLDLLAYLQRCVGYSLTGDVSEQCFFVLWGTGANGKSVFVRTVSALLGEYANDAEFSTFLLKRNDSLRNDIADLKGARFVSAIEMEEGRRLAESMVKALTGGDKIKARFLYSEYFSFRPEFKLWLASNHKPQIRGADYAMWRRVRLIPFTVTIPEQEQDPRLSDRLAAELPGVLNWALTGCEWWQAEGLGMPEAVTQATQDYRAESDPIGGFVDECCVVHPNYDVPIADLYKAYQEWCEDSGERALRKQDFSSRLDDKGFRGDKVGGKMVRIGLGLAGETLPLG